MNEIGSPWNSINEEAGEGVDAQAQILILKKFQQSSGKECRTTIHN